MYSVIDNNYHLPNKRERDLSFSMNLLMHSKLNTRKPKNNIDFRLEEIEKKRER